MSENILVVEYEPRYTDRVKQALSGQPFQPTFAKDGEEAMRALDGEQPRLIVLSSVVPKISTTELIRAIRGRKPLQDTPILLTVSGYNGKSPKQDAQRVGASDILPKPYTETEFLGKIHQMLGGEGTVVTKLTSTEIFGDLVDDEKPRAKTQSGGERGMGNVDKMLSDTLAGMMPQKKVREAAPAVPPAPAPAASQNPAQAKPRTVSADLDKMLSDTLSGARRTNTGTTPRPNVPPPPAAPAPPPAAPPAAAPRPPGQGDRFNTAKMPAFVPPAEEPDRVPLSQPVFPQPVPPTPKVEEEEVVDGVKFGQYALIEKIATGGMAEVWKARMRGVEGFQKTVAIKKILPHLSDNQDFIEMFVDEAKLAAQLNHNNIIHIYDLGKIQTSYYIAMEYIDGFDLKTILRKGEDRSHPMTVELALFVASKLASALDYAHRKKDFEDREMGLVHRDVSPQNVLVSQEGDIKLCDFGIAKAASKASHTQAGALKGKLQYMSPEQAWGRSIDRRSDIFALATVLFEMLTNRKLFTGDNELSILEQVREARVQPPSLYNDEVTPDIDKVVIKALQKDPANRYQTAGEMARDLDAILYSFKPTPTSADLAIYMHRLSTPETEMFESETVFDTPMPAAVPVAPAPTLITPIPTVALKMPAPVPVAAPAAAPAPPMATPVFAEAYETPKSGKSPIVLIAIVLVALAAAGGGAYFMTRKGGAVTPATGTTATSTAPATASTAQTAVPLNATAPDGTVGVTNSVGTQTALDPSLVDQEVAKRLAAERARLEAQTRAQTQQAATQTAAQARPPVAAPVVTATQAPAPAPVQESRPAPVQQQPEPAPAPAPVETRPAPQPAVARAREGDLIPIGTPGLIPARMVRRGNVNYPPIARAQRVQGTVVTSVLVSETGDVIDVKILRGVSQPVGLNEAAVQTMRRSTFSAGTKDGVRVKSYVTVPVEFKL
ncbi:MAG: TonB family protein [Acidobacteriota bacterium]